MLLNVDDMPILVGASGTTLVGGLFLRIAVSSSIHFSCFNFCSAGKDSVPSITLKNSSAARMVQSCSDRDERTQWVGKSFAVPAVRVAWVLVTK